ncbi:MAG: hypothetical protein ACMX3H_13645 [Sodalis sp. (in: enterobacteria)]
MRTKSKFSTIARFAAFSEREGDLSYAAMLWCQANELAVLDGTPCARL